MTLLNHTWASLCADSPASCLQFSVLGDGIVLPRARLEVLGFLEGEVAARLSSDLEGCILFLGEANVWIIVAWPWLVRLLLSFRAVGHSRSHRVRWQILASEVLCGIVAWAWHFELGFDFFASGSSETETRSRLLDTRGVLVVAAWTR